ncbi:hypothetical protein GWI72_03190 [Microvirga tunisiensis]|uniref:Uncharacterized protein n=3 Tax=Pannonibacter tanglangensis TaxID=2750084 RepID=A0ABW9ZJ52_9HYPH|nr:MULTISPECIES: hypothetical protein [unclassified Pannonibacter]NBN63636.1 hypothetical protein [Pannonibacter sp. XCT-34]NBN77270.1 hypothetical protein [Pannonibacter sp. XCT-53]
MGCAGFVAAGVIGSFYQLVTNRPPRFQVSLESAVGTVGSFLMCAFAGPFIIMRNAIRGRRIENRPIGWLVASSTIAGMWSVCSGLVMMRLVIGLAPGL